MTSAPVVSGAAACTVILNRVTINQHSISGRVVSILRVVEPERLVFTFHWDNRGGLPTPETTITVIFEERDGKTTMHFHQAFFETIEDRDGHNGGWNSSFDRLVDHLDGGALSLQTNQRLKIVSTKGFYEYRAAFTRLRSGDGSDPSCTRASSGLAGVFNPHPKSMPLGELAMHIATLPDLGKRILTEDTFDVTAPNGGRPDLVFESQEKL